MSFLARCTRVFNHKLKIKLDALKADAPKAAVSRFCEGFKSQLGNGTLKELEHYWGSHLKELVIVELAFS